MAESRPTGGADEPTLAFGRRVIQEEAASLAHLAGLLDARFERAVDLLCRAAERGGSVIVSGLGKSGLVGAKISATMASLGIPSHSVHPTEAAHGDLGRFREADVAVCLSHSGETEELFALASLLREDGIDVIAITRSESSSLGRCATVVLPDGVEREAGQGAFVAPTSSTTAAIALGDALALAAARCRRFSHEDFAKRHPGGQLGGLLKPVTDLLRFTAGHLPLVSGTETVRDALAHAQTLGRRPGALLVIDEGGALAGIFTDGDLRRLVLEGGAALDRPIGEVMTASPRTLPATALARDAVALVRDIRADEIPVVDPAGRPVGLLDVQDLVTMRLLSPSN